MPSPRVESQVDFDQRLADFMAQFYADPLGFVECAYPWPVNGEPGPDRWQRDNLTWIGKQVEQRAFDGVNPVLPIRDLVSSGHGIGKGAEVGWLADWLMSTRPNMRGTVTANTNDQLEKKTWAGIREWTKRCITAHWFEINSAIMYRIGRRESWFLAPASCAEENSEAFAGQHAKDSTSVYIFDEASAIPDKIWEVAEGGLTDGEPMIFARGNPTRNTGKFYQAAFGAGRDRWHVTIIDSRTCKFRNDALIKEWAEDYGEDSDFFRVRVRGLHPLANELQYIDGQRIIDAQRRVASALPDDPLIAGVDVSGGGSAWTVCRFRRGLDARSLRPIRINGEKSRDRNHIINVLAEALNETAPERRIDAMFIDSAFGAAVVERLHVLGHKHVHEINFGGDSPDPHYANMRAFMYGRCKEWLLRGAIPHDDNRLAHDLGVPGFHLNNKNQIVMESKKSIIERGEASPDDGDGLVLTWAMPVKISGQRRGGRWSPESSSYHG